MYDIDEIQLQERRTLVMRNRLSIEEMPPWFSTAFGKVAGVIGASGIHMTGPPFASYIHVDGEPVRFDVEAGFPVHEATSGQGDVVASTLPGGQVAHTWHTGPYEKLTDAYQELMAWIVERDMEPADKAWEIYQSDPSVEPDPPSGAPRSSCRFAPAEPRRPSRLRNVLETHLTSKSHTPATVT